MKYLIASALFILPCASSAQISIPVVKGKTTVINPGTTSTSTKFSGSMGEVGASYKGNGLTTISYCQNSRNAASIQEHNIRDTNTFRTNIVRTENHIAITHPGGTLSTIIDNGKWITVTASGGVTITANKLETINPSGETGQYFVAYNHNTSEVKNIYGACAKFERKGNVQIITNWDGSYVVMITAGGASVVVDSKGKDALAVTNNDFASVMNADGSHFIVVTENNKPQIIRDGHSHEIINTYGGLGLISGENDVFEAMFNYAKVDTDTNTDGGELVKVTIDKNTLAATGK